MKRKNLFASLVIAISALFISCNDTLDKLGFSIQPGNDKVHVGTDTIYLSAKTVQIDSVYSKTKYPILGKYMDPVFGEIKSDYIGELYFPENLEFKKNAVIDSVRLTVSYTSIIGDSLAPMELAVYKVKKELPKGKRYTNFDPEEYADMTSPIGAKSFTGKNNTYRTETYYSGTTVQEVKIYEINALLPKEIGEDFLAEFKKPGHGYLQNSETFRKHFPGLYVTTNFGSSTILNVNLTSLKVHYKYLDEKGSSQKTDTIRPAEWRLNITPEVTQINHIKNKNDNLLVDNDEQSYIKSPAGVNTEITIPISSISAQLDKSALNQARLVVHTVEEEEKDDRIKLTAPGSLLLIHKDSINQFFEKGSLHNNLTSFVASYDQNTQSYSFGNIASLVNYYNKEHEKDESNPLDQTFQLVPVDITYSNTNSGTVATAIYNQMKPSATIINKKKNKLRLDIIYSSF